MSPRKYIRKVIRIRTHLLRSGRSKKNAMAMHQAIDRLRRWIDFYPNATDEQVRRFISAHQAELLAIIPGEKCPAHQQLINQLNTYTNGKND